MKFANVFLIINLKNLIRIILIFFIWTSFFYAQSNIDIVRDVLADLNEEIIIAKKFPEIEEIEKLKNLVEKISLEEVDLSKTSNLLNDLQSLLQVNTSIDSVNRKFREINTQFNSDTQNYFYSKLLNSTTNKIILFSTSISCECTLNMCVQHEFVIQRFCKEYDYEYVIIDTWTDDQIAENYNVNFSPTIVVFDEQNKEIVRFVREENLYDKLVGIKNEMVR